MTTFFKISRALARALRLFAAVATTALSACGIDVNKEVNINPNPKIAYTVYAEAPMMPPENDVVGSRVFYDVTDEKCVPIDHSKAIGGSRADSTIYSDPKINKINNTYQIVVYDDVVSPKKRSDFSGCTWNIGSVVFYISKKGNRDPDATQGVPIGRSDLLSKTRTEQFCRIHPTNLRPDICLFKKPRNSQDYYSFSISVK